MQLTARQVELLNSTNPQDNAELLASLGGDQVLLHQLVNMFGPGGQYYDPLKYGHTSGNVAANTAGIPESIINTYKSLGIMDANGNWLKHQDNDGNWVAGAPGATFTGATVNPGSSWSGVNASGGFTGGTGVGITSPGVHTNADGTYSPVSLQQLHAAMGGTQAPAAGGAPGAATTPAAGGAPAHGMPGGGPGGSGTVPISNLFNGGGAGGGTPPGGSTPNGNTGDTGGLPTASAAPYSTPSYGSYTAPTYTDPTAPVVSPGNPMDFFNDPGYQFRLKEGLKAVQNSAAARGNLLSGDTLKGMDNYSQGLASQEYANAYNRYTNTRDFNQNVYTDARNYNRNNFNTDRAFGANQFDKDRAFQYGADTDTRNYNNQNRIWDTTFNNNNRIDARNFDYGAAKDDRNFNEDSRRWNTTFDYNAATGDRSYNQSVAETLARLGLAGASGSGSLATSLAQLLSGNTLTGAGAGAGATTGGASLISQIISQILASVSNNNIVNAITKP